MRPEAVARMVAMNAKESSERGTEGMFVVRSWKFSESKLFSFCCKGADAATKGSNDLQNNINNRSLKTDGGGVASLLKEQTRG